MKNLNEKFTDGEMQLMQDAKNRIIKKTGNKINWHDLIFQSIVRRGRAR